MAWTPKSEGKVEAINRKYDDYDILKETLTTYSGRAVFSSVFSVPPGRDFSVIMNTAATNVSTSGHVELFVSIDGTNYYRWNKAGFNATTTLFDTATVVLVYDVSTHGQFPYYKLKYTNGGGSVATQISVNGVTAFVT